ncbi:hypothetical protein M2459_001089 [Parabacteroides sp. PF5-5]|uniref:hypothetical protein n=1 Tax=unclassified Parabacteroides TaxID=2649774 RepID=UPI0024738DA0|nr:MULTISPECIES: hypothetical protein [unclassified Parabacteroides]MDH6304357.1 hypothetical protein [Parabacteroides sp. PH5-39]MDH6315490.1 hypothetical protein [Parabacteroides sp. PF5-13]MDH6319016.1 hypothetical protein [Parabacteroides sp. PH5-13]MDH6322745.1 hypothetical protein [Parabacteroides sp. PH5-8]MDH6326683.1 hypothetical protein [Parabacteroides sp. PH5-41]
MKKVIIVLVVCFVIYQMLLSDCEERDRKQRIAQSEEMLRIEKEKSTVNTPTTKPGKKTPEVPRYEIIKRTKTDDYVKKVEYSVRIFEELTKEHLELIAKDIKKKSPIGYEYIFVSYYMPSHEVGFGSWAMTRIAPNTFETQINGVSRSKIPKTELEKDNTTQIGRWTGNLIGHGVELIIYKKGNKLFLKRTFSDGSGGEDELIVKKINGTSRYYYKDKDRRYEYYVIKNGALLVYDDLGNLGEKYNP